MVCNINSLVNHTVFAVLWHGIQYQQLWLTHSICVAVTLNEIARLDSITQFLFCSHPECNSNMSVCNNMILRRVPILQSRSVCSAVTLMQKQHLWLPCNICVVVILSAIAILLTVRHTFLLLWYWMQQHYYWHSDSVCVAVTLSAKSALLTGRQCLCCSDTVDCLLRWGSSSLYSCWCCSW